MTPSGHSPIVHDHYARSGSSRTADDSTWRKTMTTNPPDHPDGVVVGYDGSPAADGAVRWAAEQAVRTGGRLDLVTAWEYPTAWGNTLPLPSDFDPSRDAQALLDPVVDRLRADHPALEVHAHVVEGHPGDVLVEASRHGALLVVASRGHRALAGVLIGSVSQHCATHAVCPVVVYRDPEPED
jgi:nucleotide-binding universal stress UspA family protein